jgi:hypothetical protein
MLFRKVANGSKVHRSLVKGIAAAMFGALMLGSYGQGAVPIAVSPTQNPSANPNPTQTPPHVVPQHVTPQRSNREVPDVPDREVPERSTAQHNSSDNKSPQRGQNSANPHMHRSNAQKDTKADHANHIAMRLQEDRKFLHDRAFHAWRHHWDYLLWLDWNLGRGSIEGNVRDASTGQPVSGARVWLRDATGRVMHSRVDQHVVRSDEFGVFAMRHVHRGTYTVRAIVAGHQANADYLINVHPGRISLALIRM